MPLDPICFEKVVLFVSARSLLKVGTFSSRTDAFAAVYIIDTRRNELVLVGVTNVVKDNSNPDWLTQITTDYQFECKQELVVRVLQHDGSSSVMDLQRHTVIAEGRFVLAQLMTAPGQKLTVAATAGKSGIAQGQIEVRGEALSHTRDELVCTFSAHNLVNKAGFFGTSDPFLRISRVNEDNSHTVVFQNTHIDNTLNPRWAAVKIPMATLCNGDIERPLRIEVLDWDRGGKHVSMGCADASVRQLLASNGAPLPVVEADKRGKKGYSSSGSVSVSHCAIEQNPTFGDFVAGGCEISLVVAIDFTMSNGDPASPQSLHYLSPSGVPHNPYQHAIQSVGCALEPYDSDHMYPVFGFGAKMRLPEGGYSPAQHCFPVYAGGVEVAGVSGVLQAYQDCVRSVMLSGPTLFGPLIMAAAQTAANAQCSQEKQKYTILLILTDGVVNDLEQTIGALISASYTPISVVIVGVGAADFSDMAKLDSDDALLSQGGKTAARDIVQFVSFNEVAAKGQHALSQAVLAEIPTQLLQYMRQHNITPNPRKQ